MQKDPTLLNLSKQHGRRRRTQLISLWSFFSTYIHNFFAWLPIAASWVSDWLYISTSTTYRLGHNRTSSRCYRRSWNGRRRNLQQRGKIIMELVRGKVLEPWKFIYERTVECSGRVYLVDYYADKSSSPNCILRACLFIMRSSEFLFLITFLIYDSNFMYWRRKKKSFALLEGAGLKFWHFLPDIIISF